jgi:hypothetical protein
VGAKIVTKIKDGFTYVWDLAVWVATQLTTAWDSLTTGDASSWLDKVKNLGGNMVDYLKQGIEGKWDAFVDWWRQLLDSANNPDNPTDPGSPVLANPPVPKSGEPTWGSAHNFSRAVGAGVTIQMFFGADSLSFPNVRDGRDADSVRTVLQEEAMRGYYQAQVGGK